MFGTGALMFKVGLVRSAFILEVFGAILLIFAIIYSYYIRKRFTQLFNDNNAVSLSEFQIKRLTSVIICFAALAYLISLLNKMAL
jgi:hypothetical protein